MTTQAEDHIVKQLEDRYHTLACSQQSDGSLHITADRIGTGKVAWRRVVKVTAGGRIVHDTGEFEYDDYHDH